MSNVIRKLFDVTNVKLLFQLFIDCVSIIVRRSTSWHHH